MSKTSLVILITAACLLMQALPGQGSLRRQRSTASKALHKAWLMEKLDLNTSAAAGAYDATIKKSTANMPERWIAVARLEELGRLGVLRPEPRSRPTQMPAAVRKALAKLDTPIKYKKVLQNPDVETELEALRPATPLIQEWAHKQLEPVLQEGLLQDYRARLRRRTTAGARERLFRQQAYDVLECELEGKRTQADHLRLFSFPNWKPPEVTGKPEVILAAAKKRLAEWIEEVTWGRRILRKLQANIVAAEKSGAGNAISFLQRLPRYSEKLLGPEEPKPDEKK